MPNFIGWKAKQDQVAREIRAEQADDVGPPCDPEEMLYLVDRVIERQNRRLEAQVQDNRNTKAAFKALVNKLLEIAQKNGFPDARISDFHYDSVEGNWCVDLDLGRQAAQSEVESIEESVEDLMRELEVPDEYIECVVVYTPAAT